MATDDASAQDPAPPPDSGGADAPAAPTPPTPPSPAGAPAWAGLLGLVLALGLLGGWLGGRVLARSDRGASAAADGVSLVAAAQRRVAPAVVEIQVESPRRSRGTFRLPGSGASGLPPRPRIEHSLGSGLIVDARGYIVTNRHVIHRAQTIAVTVPSDPHTYFARLVGADTETDLALIKIDAGHPLPTAVLGNSEALRVGDTVLAIGSPFGLDNTVTSGIVSALHRAMDPDAEFESFIQTDAPINPGNSGGPLVNLAGQVVGINTSIYTYTDGYQGVGFALPSQLVAQVYPQLMRQGHVTRASIGVYFESALDPAVRRVYHLGAGVPLSQVAAHGPAAVAGLQAGDVITSLDGRPITDGDALMDAVEFLPIGQPVRVGYQRNAQARTATMPVADRAKLYPDQVGDEEAQLPEPAPPPDLGLSFQAGQAAGGVEVKSVAPDSFADSIGMRRDDVVLEINHQPVHSLAELRRIEAGIRGGQDVAMVLRRPNGDGTNSRWLVGGTVPPGVVATAVARARLGPRR